MAPIPTTNEKVKFALGAGLDVILCVGETLE
jgi:triosephosphate isomerase